MQSARLDRPDRLDGHFKREYSKTVSQNLSLSALSSIAGLVEVPKYDRSQISAGILHIGVGNFHRAHQAVYLDDLFNAGLGHDWGLVGAGLRPNDAVMRDKLASQDWLTTVLELDVAHQDARVTGAMINFLDVFEDKQNIVEALSNPAIRIASLTITEGGYCIDSGTGRFDPNHPDIQRDVQSPQAPKGVFGILVAGLAARRAAGTRPFTIMSCDNVSHNGLVTRAAVVGMAELIDSELAKWIDEEVTFPNSMVDRVTPFVSDTKREAVKTITGINDAWPVICEPFRQWVMEDRFCNGRPPLEEVGVTFTDQVAAFELMKLRILNGGHAAIAYPAGLLDIEYVHEAMAHPLINAYLTKLIQTEVISTVPEVPGTDLGDYFQKVVQRFSNPEVADTIVRLCLDGSDRQPKFIIPSIHDRLKAGQSVQGLALETALWCRYCTGETQSGATFQLQDSRAGLLADAAQQTRSNPQAFLEIDEVFGDLRHHAKFKEIFATHVEQLWREGVVATLTRYIG